jgi:hypothetical protein
VTMILTVTCPACGAIVTVVRPRDDDEAEQLSPHDCPGVHPPHPPESTSPT